MVARYRSHGTPLAAGNHHNAEDQQTGTYSYQP
jgi:hypothetical protein